MGLVQMCAFMVIGFIGLLYVGSGRAAILAYTTPLWVLPLSLGSRLMLRIKGSPPASPRMPAMRRRRPPGTSR